MANYKEWMIKYHGNLDKLFKGTGIMVDKINEHYAIIQAGQREITYLKDKIQIEHIEKSKVLLQLDHNLSLDKMISDKKAQYDLSGSGVTVGWISHKARINYHEYKQDQRTRLTCLHNGSQEFNEQQIRAMESSQQDHEDTMDLCIGNKGIAPDSQVILVNWEKDEFSTADAIRSVRFIIKRAKATEKPLVIYLPFDISGQSKDLTRAIISHMILWGKIGMVSNLETGDQMAQLNQDINLVPIYSTCGPLTVGVLLLMMEWNIVKENNPELYGQLLRTYYLKHIRPLLEKGTKHSRTLSLAYEFVPQEADIDAFIIYNYINTDPNIAMASKANLYLLVYPYLGIRGTLSEIKEILDGYLEVFVTGSLACVFGREPIEIKPVDFKAASITSHSGDFRGANTLIAIVDSGIDYTNPVFIDSNGKTRILAIWDQTIGQDSPYGYGTVYSSDMINQALESDNPLDLVAHKDSNGSGTILAGIAAGYSLDGEKSYKGVAPDAGIVVVKLVPASPVMQDIYHGKYNPLGFSALDIARAFEFLTSLANQHQKPISICLPMGTNSGSHDGVSVIDNILMSYAQRPGVSIVLPTGEEADKGHHASGNLKEEREQEVKLVIPKGQPGFIIEIWAVFGDRIEVSLRPPKIG